VIIDPATDLAQFAGARVVINGTRTARVTTIRHGIEATRVQLHDGVWGEGIDDPHGDCRGGATAFWWPYGTDLALEKRS
jgi:hypothetical protein